MVDSTIVALPFTPSVRCNCRSGESANEALRVQPPGRQPEHAFPERILLLALCRPSEASPAPHRCAGQSCGPPCTSRRPRFPAIAGKKRLYRRRACSKPSHAAVYFTPPCTSRRRPNAQHADDQPLISVAAHAQPGGTTFVMPHASCVMRPRPKPSVPATARFTFRCTARANLPAAFVAASVADLVPSAEARSRLTMSIYRQNQSQRDEVQFFRRLWLRYAAVNPS